VKPLSFLTLALCPMEVFFLVVCTASGCLALTETGPPDPLNSLLPGWIVLAWEISLLTGAVISLLGLFLSRWLIVRVGYTVLAPAALAYAIALAPIVQTLTGWFSVGFLVAFSASCLWRITQVTVILRRSL
jgi:hypothetical protein